jgi:hypothetical protein
VSIQTARDEAIPTNGILLLTPSPAGPVLNELTISEPDKRLGNCALSGCDGTIFERTIPVVHPITGERSTSADCYCTKGGWKHKFCFHP